MGNSLVILQKVNIKSILFLPDKWLHSTHNDQLLGEGVVWKKNQVCQPFRFIGICTTDGDTCDPHSRECTDRRAGGCVQLQRHQLSLHPRPSQMKTQDGVQMKRSNYING